MPGGALMSRGQMSVSQYCRPSGLLAACASPVQCTHCIQVGAYYDYRQKLFSVSTERRHRTAADDVFSQWVRYVRLLEVYHRHHQHHVWRCCCCRLQARSCFYRRAWVLPDNKTRVSMSLYSWTSEGLWNILLLERPHILAAIRNLNNSCQISIVFARNVISYIDEINVPPQKKILKTLKNVLKNVTKI